MNKLFLKRCVPVILFVFLFVCTISGNQPDEIAYTVTKISENSNIRTDRRPIHIGYYDKDANKTFVCWMGAMSHPIVKEYDHATRKWSEDKQVGVSPFVDKHNYPGMLRGTDGRIFVFHGCHNSTMKMAVSPQPGSIAGEWKDTFIEEAERASYPAPVMTKDGAMYVFYRDTRMNNKYSDDRPYQVVKSTDDGKTWNRQMVIDPYPRVTDSMMEVYNGKVTYEPGGDGKKEKIHLAWTICGEKAGKHAHATYGRNVYYAYLDPTNDHLYNIDNVDLGTTIDNEESDKYCLVLDTGIPEKGHAAELQISVQSLASGMPLIHFSSRLHDNLVTARYDERKWTFTPVGNEKGEPRELEKVQGDTFRIYYPSGTNINVYLSENGGQTWNLETVIPIGQKISRTYIIDNYRPEVKLLMTEDGDGDIRVAKRDVFVAGEKTSRWDLEPDGSIVWYMDSRLPHNDHIEMSGKQLSVVLRYGVDHNQSFQLERSIVWPMLRFEPNKTRSHLNKRFGLDICDFILVDNQTMTDEKVEKITLEGLMVVESDFPKQNLHMIRTLYPSTSQPVYLEKYVLKNTGDKGVTIDIPDMDISYRTNASTGIYGEYVFGMNCSKKGYHSLNPGEELTFYMDFYARKISENLPEINPEKELASRQDFVKEIGSKLVLETPDPVLNAAFAFAKIRGSESIYQTKGGLMHGPGGEAYYAAIWANDQAEYINPFFPFLGYETGNESALNSFRHFARFMNDEYKPIPSSIIAEGDGIWHGAKDRGDCAMIAYGAARYALVKGDKKEATELWPLIEWCLEYCKRQLNDKGVVRSDSDELENRFPAGDANLCTSGLYYDALISAVYLGKDLGKSAKQLGEYKKESVALKTAIEKHFGYNVEGFDTYRYYEGNDILRSWICIPLTVGIFDRSEGTIAALFSPRLWTSDGLLTQAGTETFWDRSTLYALRGVFAAGATKKGLDYLERYSQRRLLGEHVPYPIEAWPEGSQRHLSAESGLYCRIYTEGIFGIRPTGLNSFEMCPQMPAEWNYMNLKSVHAFNKVFDIDITRKGKKLEIIVKNEKGNVLKKQINPGDVLSFSL